LLGIDVSSIVIPDTDQTKQRRATRTIQFEIFGDAASASALAADLQSGNLAAQLSSKLKQQYNLNISVEVSGGDIAESLDQRPDGEVWEEVDGAYLLRACPAGYLLVNTTGWCVLSFVHCAIFPFILINMLFGSV
jgi:hypothetical protein